MDKHRETSITPRDLHERISREPVEMLDVRTPWEYAMEHVRGVSLVPLGELDPVGYLRARGQAEGPIYVFCQHGIRAARAIEGFQRAGFEGCVLLEGGMQAWIDAGLPVERGG